MISSKFEDFFADLGLLHEKWLSLNERSDPELTLSRLKMLKSIIKKLHDKKMDLNLRKLTEYICLALNSCEKIWLPFSQSSAEGLNQCQRTFVSCLEKIIFLVLRLCPMSLIGDERVTGISERLSEKFCRLLEGAYRSPACSEAAQEMARGLYYTLSDCPLVLASRFEPILGRLIGVFLSPPDQDLHDSASLLLYKVLNSFLLYTPAEGEFASAKKFGVQQTRCAEIFKTTFRPELIEQIIQAAFRFFAAKSSDSGDEKEVADIQSDVLGQNDKEIGPARICLLLVDRMVHRFPETSLRVLAGFVDSLASPDVPCRLADGLSMILASLPRFYSKMNVPKAQRLSISATLDLLASLAPKQPIFARRFLFLLKAYVIESRAAPSAPMFDLLISCLSSEDKDLVFQAVDCLAEVVVIGGPQLDCQRLAAQALPPMLRQLQVWALPTLIWRISTAIKELLLRCFPISCPSLSQALASADLSSLFSRDQKTRMVFVETMTALAETAGVPGNSPVFNFLLSALEQPSLDQSDDTIFTELQLVNELLQNCTPQTPELTRLAQLFKSKRFSTQFLHKKTGLIFCKCIEQLVCLGVTIDYLEVRSDIDGLFNRAHDNCPDTNNMMMLIYFRIQLASLALAIMSGKFVFGEFTKPLENSVAMMMIGNNFKYIIDLKTASLDFFCRVALIDPPGFWSFLTQHLPADKIFGGLIQSMEYLCTNRSKYLCCTTLLHLLDVAPIEVLRSNFEAICRELVGTLSTFLREKQPKDAPVEEKKPYAKQVIDSNIYGVPLLLFTFQAKMNQVQHRAKTANSPLEITNPASKNAVLKFMAMPAN